jgi:hypothetical protein
MSQNGSKPVRENPVLNSEATRRQPGRSGNPGGKPKTAAFARACREVLSAAVPGDADGRTYAQAIAGMLAEKARAGDVRAAMELADRTGGRARQSIEIENTALAQAFERMTEAELRTYAETGALPDWLEMEGGNVTK